MCVCVCVRVCVCAPVWRIAGSLQYALEPLSTCGDCFTIDFFALTYTFLSPPLFHFPAPYPPPLLLLLRPQQRALCGVDSAQQKPAGEGPMRSDSAATTGTGRSGSASTTPNATDPLCVHARPELEATRLRHRHGDSRPAVEACMAIYARPCYLVSA